MNTVEEMSAKDIMCFFRESIRDMDFDINGDRYYNQKQVFDRIVSASKDLDIEFQKINGEQYNSFAIRYLRQYRGDKCPDGVISELIIKFNILLKVKNIIYLTSYSGKINYALREYDFISSNPKDNRIRGKFVLQLGSSFDFRQKDYSSKPISEFMVVPSLKDVPFGYSNSTKGRLSEPFLLYLSEPEIYKDTERFKTFYSILDDNLKKLVDERKVLFNEEKFYDQIVTYIIENELITI